MFELVQIIGILVSLSSVWSTFDVAVGLHVCWTLELHNETVVRMIWREFHEESTDWCWDIPPRCTYTHTTVREVPELVTVEVNRTMARCCPGAELTAFKTGCRISDPCDDSVCLNGHCDGSRCVCTPHWKGDNCDVSEILHHWNATSTDSKTEELNFEQVVLDDDVEMIGELANDESANLQMNDINSKAINGDLQFREERLPNRAAALYKVVYRDYTEDGRRTYTQQILVATLKVLAGVGVMVVVGAGIALWRQRLQAPRRLRPERHPSELRVYNSLSTTGSADTGMTTVA